VLRDYQKEHPAAMRSFNDDLGACLVYLRCPLAHHKSIRTTNLLERAFQESRRRTKVIPHFFTKASWAWVRKIHCPQRLASNSAISLPLTCALPSCR
jgi:transposase-like protein